MATNPSLFLFCDLDLIGTPDPVAGRFQQVTDDGFEMVHVDFPW
jgi:hypothetical protein